jgi:hypothetical protein
MTPEEWDRCEDPQEMLAFLGRGASMRKLRLFTIACCLGGWSPLYAGRCRSLVSLAERYADGQAAAADLAGARRIAYPEELLWTISPNPGEAARAVFRSGPCGRREPKEYAGRLREVIGNPFHPPAPPEPAALAWHDGAARRLAGSIYAARRFGDLPVLADALEEAGLTDAELLGHLRGPGTHVLGCWALDAVLSKG